MFFNLSFRYFLPVVLFCIGLFSITKSYQNYLLIVASYYFYLSWIEAYFYWFFTLLDYFRYIQIENKAAMTNLWKNVVLVSCIYQSRISCFLNITTSFCFLSSLPIYCNRLSYCKSNFWNWFILPVGISFTPSRIIPSSTFIINA
jgi:hypothetical protein